MKTIRNYDSTFRGRAASLVRRTTPFMLALAATLVSLPGSALDYPNVPLQSGRAYPPANMMFVLDDSGSMAWVAMPADIANDADLQNTLNHKSYLRNTIYYNPGVTYLPWMQADSTRFTSGTAYGSAHSSANNPTGTTDLAAAVRTYFVPKAPAAANDATPIAEYYRYQILTNGSVVRSQTGRANQSKGVLNVGCGNDSGDEGFDATNNVNWRFCTYATPIATRDEAAERSNYAIWYSYHRTRMKVAKAGASEAFSQVGEGIRVGYNSIWNRSAFPIPVDTDGGLFRGANKSTWYTRMQAAAASGGTPLHTALQRTGDYFSTDAPWGPIDPVSSQILSCRQSFALLTTDGYWNNLTGYTPVGDADGTAGPNGYVVASPYRDNFSTNPNTRPDTLADVAMHYWKTDLRAALVNNVPDSGDDPATWQHMSTFGVSIGLRGTLDPSKSVLTSITNGSTRWPDPIPTANATRIDDLWHASVNGRGNFIVAGNAKQFTEGVLDAINTVAERQGSASNVSTNSTSFTADTRVYQATYLSGKWTGELSAYDATSAGVSASSSWRVSERMPAWDSRKIFTWNGTAGATFPTAGQIVSLNRPLRITSPVTGLQNANYIRGDASLEPVGGELRKRDSRLGDIVNSSPMYVKDNETIFVGANDGMLHAFAAVTSGSGTNEILGGTELFAYVPGGVNLSDLASLSDPNYEHRYFVDGPIVVSTRNQTPGKNYLVGALGRGGKGVFGLDVTNPKSFTASNAKWELTSGGNLGQVLGEPLIVTLNDGANTKATIFGNGINSTNGRAVLYVVNLATGAIIQEIDTGIGSDNGLSAARGWDDDNNGTVDYVYAGDLKGNVWKFDFSAATGTIGYGGDPMFSTPSGQPISAGLALGRDPITNNRWVFAGTGRFITEADPEDNTVQSMYGLIDDGSVTIDRAELTERQIVVAGTTLRAFEPASGLPAGSRGWFVDLGDPKPGERVVSRPQIRGTVLLFSSIIPPTNDPCNAGGSGYLNAIDAFTGSSTALPYFNNYPADNYLTAQDGTLIPIGSIDPGVGMPTLPTIIDSLVVVGGSRGTLASKTVNPQGGPPRRTSWREIIGD